MSDKPYFSAVVFVSDVPRLSDFYRELAGLSLQHQDADHALLQGDGFQLVVHRIFGASADQQVATDAVSVREDSHVKLCFPVASIAAARRTALALGGAIKAPEFEWEARGFRACDGHDPEGNVIQVRETVGSRDVAK